MNNSPAVPKQRIGSLDVFRGIAVLLVLLQHAPIKPTGIWSVFLPLQHAGWTGVDLFFVLSGFLVGGLLINEVVQTDRLDWRRFLLRRGLKLWPAYYCMLFVAFIHELYHGASMSNSTLGQFIPNLLNYQNYVLDIHLSSRVHTWSLAVEEHFYSLLAVAMCLVIAIDRAPARLGKIPALCILLMVLCICVRTWTMFNVDPALRYEYSKQTHLRVDGLLLGVLLAHYHRFQPRSVAWLGRQRWTKPLAVILLLPASFMPFASLFMSTIGFTLIAMGFSLLLLASVADNKKVVGNPEQHPIRTVLMTVGLYSYSIYLWHLEFIPGVIAFRIAPLLPLWMTWPLGNLIYASAACVSGIFLGKLIEIPILRMRDRLLPARALAIELCGEGRTSDPVNRSGSIDPALG